MGVVTIFTLPQCEFCDRVRHVLHDMADEVLAELRAANEPDATIEFNEVACEGANAALCVRLTRSFGAPHVFFNTEYIGNCDTTCELAERPACEYNLIRNKLRNLARQPRPCPPFPPPPDTRILKVSDTVAFSGQPTAAQLSTMALLGIKGVVNLAEKENFCCGEKDRLGVDVQYTHVALGNKDLSVDQIAHAVDVVRQSPAPVLVHDELGVRAALVCLIVAALENGNDCSTPEMFVEWGELLGVDLKPVASKGSKVLALKQKAHNNTNGTTPANALVNPSIRV